MNAEVFAEWLRRQDHSVIRTTSSYWYDAGPRVYQAFPYHWVIQPPEEELLELLRQKRAIALRYSTPVDNPLGCISYHTIYDDLSYTFDNLKKKRIRIVRIALKKCRVEPISFERLAEDGWYLEMDTLSRQGRRVKISKETWRRRCLSVADLPGFEAWGALVNGHLAASLFTFQSEDCCEMLAQQSHRDYLKANVNSALCFIVTKTMINRPRIRSVFYGLHSLDAPASLDVFKYRMSYRAKPVRQRVVFHPWLQPFANSLTHKMLVGLLRLDPGNRFLAKGEGLLRFHLQGKRSL